MMREEGQVTAEFVLVTGLVIVPALLLAGTCLKEEWRKTECAFQSFKTARASMIRSGRSTSIEEVTLIPLEELDRSKGGLEPADLLKTVSSLWEQLSASSSFSSDSES